MENRDLITTERIGSHQDQLFALTRLFSTNKYRAALAKMMFEEPSAY